MPQEYIDCISFASSAGEGIQIAKRHIAETNIPATTNKKAIATISLRSFLANKPDYLPSALRTFLKNAPRVGVIASGNIGNNKEPFNLSNRTFRGHFVDDAADLGARFAKAGAALVLMGNRQGLREKMAQTALKANGKVIWLQTSNTRLPINLRLLGKKELIIEVPRYYERARLFATLAQGMAIVAGGVHTINEAFSHLTRNQTRHGDFCDVVPHCHDVDRDRMVAHVFNPILSDNDFSLWGAISKQIRHCANEGFLAKKDQGLLPFYKRSGSIVDNVMKDINKHPDFLSELAKKGSSRRLPLTSVKKQESLALK
jgi:predicted Rossmann-fold nucleotide-binding protein